MTARPASEVDLDDRAANPEWPTVTVVVPTRDRPELLRRAVDTILAQRYEGEIECVVVFDQSEPSVEPSDSDGRRLRAVTNDRSPGLAGARNTGALLARGELVAFCDDDDEWLPDKLTAQVAALRAEPAAAVATCGIYIHYGNRTIQRLPARSRITLDQLLESRTPEIHSSTIVVKKDEFVSRIGMVDEGLPGSYAEDYEWQLRAASVSPLVAVQTALVRVHWHPSSFFADRWQTIISAIEYLLAKHPEFERAPRGLARLYGRLAFAHAALGHRAEARRWALRCVRIRWQERRAYLALAISVGLLSPDAIVRVANATGRGI